MQSMVCNLDLTQQFRCKNALIHRYNLNAIILTCVSYPAMFIDI